MASPNPNRHSAATKQITFAAFNRYMKTMCEPSSPLPQRREDSPTYEQPSTCQLTNGTLSPTLGSPTPGSPSAITPTPGTEPADFWSEQAISSSSKRHGGSEKVRIDLHSLVSQMGHHVDTSLPGNDDHITDLIVNRLQMIGDEFDVRLHSRSIWCTIRTAFLSEDGSVLQQFSNTISTLKKELSLQMIVKVFYFGYQLLTTFHPLDYYGEQQWQILSVFTNFLLNELSDWIDQQGGWETLITDSSRSYSTSDLPDHELSLNNLFEIEDRTPTEEQLPQHDLTNSYNCSTPPLVRSQTLPPNSKRSVSMSLSMPRGARSRPTTLPMNISHSYPRQSSRESPQSPSTAPSHTRGSLTNVVSFGIGVSFGIALCTFFFK